LTAIQFICTSGIRLTRQNNQGQKNQYHFRVTKSHKILNVCEYTLGIILRFKYLKLTV